MKSWLPNSNSENNRKNYEGDFEALNGDPHFQFNEAISLVISCKDQKEVDYFWKKLTANAAFQKMLKQVKLDVRKIQKAFEGAGKK